MFMSRDNDIEIGRTNGRFHMLGHVGNLHIGVLVAERAAVDQHMLLPRRADIEREQEAIAEPLAKHADAYPGECGSGCRSRRRHRRCCRRRIRPPAQVELRPQIPVAALVSSSLALSFSPSVRLSFPAWFWPCSSPFLIDRGELMRRVLRRREDRCAEQPGALIGGMQRIEFAQGKLLLSCQTRQASGTLADAVPNFLGAQVRHNGAASLKRHAWSVHIVRIYRLRCRLQQTNEQLRRRAAIGIRTEGNAQAVWTSNDFVGSRPRNFASPPT